MQTNQVVLQCTAKIGETVFTNNQCDKGCTAKATQCHSQQKYTLPVKVSPVLYLEVKIAGSLS
jgi:hypothetical protein